MQYLQRLSLSALLFTLMGLVSSAYADGTNSGTIVTNSVSMTYTVNSVSQTASASVDFTVDRRLRLDVTTPQTDWVSAVPGQTQGAGNASSIQFVVTNNSNDGLDVVIALIDQALQQVDGFTAVGTTPITPLAITVWEDTNGDGILDGGENTLGNTAGTYALTGTLAEDEARTISVSIDVDGGATSDLYQTYTLVAAAANAGVALGNDDSGNISPSGTASNVVNDLNAVEVVFADGAAGSTLGDDEGYDFILDAPTAADDAASDGQAANASGFRTRVALGIAKYVEVLWDPIAGDAYQTGGAALTGNNPKVIPGAVLMYVIGVSADAGLAATTVLIDDDIPQGPVALGNQSGATIEIPDTVDITINGTPVTFDLDNSGTGVAADNQIHVQACGAAALTSQSAFSADPAEVDDADLGNCAANDTGYVVYFVTVDDTAT